MIQSICTNKLDYLSLSQISHPCWEGKMLGLKLKDIDKLIFMITELTAKVEDPQLKAFLFLTDQHSSQTMVGEEEEILKRFITPFKINRLLLKIKMKKLRNC